MLRHLMEHGRYEVVSEEEALQTRAAANESRLQRGKARAAAASVSAGGVSKITGSDASESGSVQEAD